MLPGHQDDPVDVLALAWRDLDLGNTAEELDSARKRFEFALHLDPTSMQASYGLSLARLAQFECLCSAAPRAQLDIAEKVIRRALNLAPDNPQALRHGRRSCFFARGRTKPCGCGARRLTAALTIRICRSGSPARSSSKGSWPRRRRI